MITFPIGEAFIWTITQMENSDYWEMLVGALDVLLGDILGGYEGAD
jgi:hypothetical protein